MVGLMLAVMMAFHGVALAKVTTTESNPPGGGQTCTITTGNGGGIGTVKGEEKGNCNSANAPTFPN
jgi:hypothetical protein